MTRKRRRGTRVTSRPVPLAPLTGEHIAPDEPPHGAIVGGTPEERAQLSPTAEAFRDILRRASDDVADALTIAPHAEWSQAAADVIADAMLETVKLCQREVMATLAGVESGGGDV